MKTLQIGSRGAEVRQLQQLLNYWGIPTQIDGIFGDKTLQSVKQFQSKRINGVVYATANLIPDGVVGNETWAELTKTVTNRLNSNNIHPQINAFLKMIRVPEGTSDRDGYRIMFTGKKFDSFTDHPRILQSAGELWSDAAGAYQFLSTTWDSVAQELGLRDFSPENQDQAAIELIRRRGAYEDVIDGRIIEALEKCSYEWASLPPGRYGQPSIGFSEAQQLFINYGGTCNQ